MREISELIILSLGVCLYFLIYMSSVFLPHEGYFLYLFSFSFCFHQDGEVHNILDVRILEYECESLGYKHTLFLVIWHLGVAHEGAGASSRHKTHVTAYGQ